jgi:hypothetical protein
LSLKRKAGEIPAFRVSIYFLISLIPSLDYCRQNTPSHPVSDCREPANRYLCASEKSVKAVNHYFICLSSPLNMHFNLFIQLSSCVENTKYTTIEGLCLERYLSKCWSIYSSSSLISIEIVKAVWKSWISYAFFRGKEGFRIRLIPLCLRWSVNWV